MKVKRNYDLLERVAREVYYDEAEPRCAMIKRAMEGARNNVKKRVMRHLFNCDDGLVVRLRPMKKS